MVAWLGNLSRWNTDQWEALGRVREGDTKTAVTPLISSRLIGPLAGTTVQSPPASAVEWDLALMRDPQFATSLRACLGPDIIGSSTTTSAGASWWARILANELPPALPGLPSAPPPPSLAARHLEAIIAVVSKVITVQW